MYAECEIWQVTTVTEEDLETTESETVQSWLEGVP
jgi:hypothetical protein